MTEKCVKKRKFCVRLMQEKLNIHSVHSVSIQHCQLSVRNFISTLSTITWGWYESSPVHHPLLPFSWCTFSWGKSISCGSKKKEKGRGRGDKEWIDRGWRQRMSHGKSQNALNKIILLILPMLRYSFVYLVMYLKFSQRVCKMFSFLCNF